MKLTKKSKQLMTYFNNNNNNIISHVKTHNKTILLLSELYRSIVESYNFLLTLKKQHNKIYSVKIKHITNISQISKPKSFNQNSFPEHVRNYINTKSLVEIIYSFSLYDRVITIIFILENDDSEYNINVYNDYVDSIILWLFILNKYSSKNCSANLIIYLYFTSLKKTFPKTNLEILDEINVNTAFTTTCQKDSEIVVFRKEEWFKVLIHETFHNFGLDFSDMNTIDSNNFILSILKVESQVNLYESYTETWAEIINILFCSFLTIKNKNNFDDFISKFETLINLERMYSYFQMVKILHFMGLTYKDLYSTTSYSKSLRDTMYKEKTNVLSYYVLKTILLNNYQGFLLWCKINNTNLLQFKRNEISQISYCELIKKNYKTQSMLENVDKMKNFLLKINEKHTKTFLLSNLRMTLCEMG
jgi:uncharacterized protein YerC